MIDIYIDYKSDMSITNLYKKYHRVSYSIQKAVGLVEELTREDDKKDSEVKAKEEKIDKLYGE